MNTQKPVYNQEHCKIYFHEALKCVHLDWNGFATSEKFREACNVSLETLIKNGADKMIADNSKAKIVSVEDQKWMNEQWFPKALAAGFTISAVVVAKDVFRDMAVRKIVNNIGNGEFTVQFFDTYQDAENWIRELTNRTS